MVTVASPIREKKEKPKVTVHFSIPKDHPLHSKFNLHGLKVGKPHKMILHGKIYSMSEDEYGKSLGLTVEHIGEKAGGSKGSSVGEIIKGLRSKKEKSSSEEV